MKGKVLLLTLLMTAVALAGCTDKGTPDEPGGPVDDPSKLKEGKGAISGFLIDDRFRPIAGADVLLQEAGLTTTSNADGEFQFVDLEPGTYTLRVTAEGHEAKPERVSVEEGAFAEAQIIARRAVSEAGTILTYEYAAFSSCGFNAVVIGTPYDCTGDLSGDTDRAAFTVDYTGLNATHMVMEMRASSAQYFDVWVRNANGGDTCSDAYQILGGPDTQYLRFQLDLNQSAPNDASASGRDCEVSKVWDNLDPVQTVMYLNSLGFDEGAGYGVGAYLGVQANFLQSVFLGEPEVDVDSYCVYCS